MSAAATDIEINPTIAGLALALLIAGLVLFFWGVRRRNLSYMRTANPIIWALVAMGPALLLFSIFPSTKAEGELGTFTLGGAFAAFALVWYLGTRLARDGIDADADVEGLRAALATARSGKFARAQTDDPTLRVQDDLRYRLRSRKAELVILTGDLRNVRQADVWVSPENTNMQPSRFYERSISAIIRYYAAERDDVGDPRRDVIGDDLTDAMHRRSKTVVPAAAVIATGPGALAASNEVKRIFHVAAVEGSPGAGYAPVAQIGRCVTRALERMDAPEEAAHDLRSILFPLLGTGVAAGDAESISADIVSAAAEYLKQREDSRVRRVYLLAYRRSELYHWIAAADGCNLLECVGGSVERQLAGAY